ncbi:centrosomal protein of 44 kDa isoform X2 [Tiliqua scincoides]|uniref:centrosomal protein of 44 kDa isoform X2 n=1 Tax=Tiliqua scincoides TaxID=71010 RepID=UPI003461DD1A
MATGDLKGNLRKIEQGLRLLNYPRDVDYAGLARGDPSAFLPLINYCFTSFSPCVTELLVESDVELMGKNDLRFIDAVYKAKYQTRKKIHSVKSQPQVNFSDHLDSATFNTMNFQEKPQRERHKSKINVHIPEEIILEVVEKEDEIVHGDDVLEEEIVHNDDVVEYVSEPIMEDNSNQLKELKSQLAELQEKLNKLNWMEEKLQVLEDKLQGKVIVDEKDWNNLLSRVLLLETQLLLQSKKADVSADFNNVSEENTSSRNSTPAPSDREKVELLESLPSSSGYNSLLSTDPSPKATVVNCTQSEASEETTIQRMKRINKMIEETSELLKTSSNTS